MTTFAIPTEGNYYNNHLIYNHPCSILYHCCAVLSSEIDECIYHLHSIDMSANSETDSQVYINSSRDKIHNKIARKQNLISRNLLLIEQYIM